MSSHDDPVLDVRKQEADKQEKEEGAGKESAIGRVGHPVQMY